jgi:predicted kinase
VRRVLLQRDQLIVKGLCLRRDVEIETVRKKCRERQRQREREVPQLLLNLTNALVTFLSCPPRDWKKNIRIASQNSNDPMKREEAG